MNSNGVQETSQEISVSIDSPLDLRSRISLKNKIFSGFSQFRMANIGIESIFPSIITGNIYSGYITYSNESCDTINNEYSFTKRSYYDNNNSATWEFSHSVDFNGNNIDMTNFLNGVGGFETLKRDRTFFKYKCYEIGDIKITKISYR